MGMPIGWLAEQEGKGGIRGGGLAWAYLSSKLTHAPWGGEVPQKSRATRRGSGGSWDARIEN